MKLLSKYNRVNILATIVVLLLSAVFYYFFIETILVHQLDKNLVVEEKEIIDYINENAKLPESLNTKDEQETYIPTNDIIVRKFSSVKLHEKEYNKNAYYRQLEFPVTVNGKTYKAEVRKSQEETEDIVQLILKITLIMVLVLLVVLFIINRFIFSKLWKPFNSTLRQIKLFNVSGKDAMDLEETNITEFAELNSAVIMMTKKVIDDYNEIKDFTENASHEIQTPLAIIKSKLEMLSQSENLVEEQMNAIQAIAETTNRLSRLNQSLILLTKIDNKQYGESKELNVTELLLSRLSNYEELLQAKQIGLINKINPGVKLVLNETLADILITNLLSNAIKHNIEKGFIEIELNKSYLAISNPGATLITRPSTLFERFKKESSSNNSLGLGLSIVKKICDTYGFEIKYNYSKEIHTLIVSF